MTKLCNTSKPRKVNDSSSGFTTLTHERAHEMQVDGGESNVGAAQTKRKRIEKIHNNDGDFAEYNEEEEAVDEATTQPMAKKRRKKKEQSSSETGSATIVAVALQRCQEAQRAPPTRDLRPAGWEQAIADTSKKTFYFNKVSGERRWDKPPPAEALAMTPGNEHYFNDAGETEWETISPHDSSDDASCLSFPNVAPSEYIPRTEVRCSNLAAEVLSLRDQPSRSKQYITDHGFSAPPMLHIASSKLEQKKHLDEFEATSSSTLDEDLGFCNAKPEREKTAVPSEKRRVAKRRILSINTMRILILGLLVFGLLVFCFTLHYIYPTKVGPFTRPVEPSKLNEKHYLWPCLYARLGLPKDASERQIKKQYRKLALRYHPDKSRLGDASIRFQAVTEAYHKLLGR